MAEAHKSEVILASEASREDQINRAEGEAEAIFRRAEATARGVNMLAVAIGQSGGTEAVSLRVAEQYLDAFGEIAKQGTTMLLPSNAHDPASMVAQALSIYSTLGAKQQQQQPPQQPPQPSGGGDAAGAAPRSLAAGKRGPEPAAPGTPAQPRVSLQAPLE